MKARISKVVMSVPGVMDALEALGKAGARGDLSKESNWSCCVPVPRCPRGDDQFSRARGNWPSLEGSSE